MYILCNKNNDKSSLQKTCNMVDAVLNLFVPCLLDPCNISVEWWYDHLQMRTRGIRITLLAWRQSNTCNGWHLTFDFHPFSVATVGCLVLSSSCSQASPFQHLQGKAGLLDLSGRTLGDDLTLSLFVEFMPHVQLSTMGWFSEAYSICIQTPLLWLWPGRKRQMPAAWLVGWLSATRHHSLWECVLV